jgi:hypothetical protein
LWIADFGLRIADYNQGTPRWRQKAESMSAGDPSDPIRNPQSAIRNRSWLWFFAALVALSVAAVAINWVYNARQQLTMEQLTAAQERWDRNGPRDYDLMIDKNISSAASAAGEEITERITVEVRDGKARAATSQGQPVPPWALREYDMPGWLSFVEEFLRRDARPGAPRSFRVADFDPKTGALLRFVRRVSGTHERQQLVIRLTPANPERKP